MQGIFLVSVTISFSICKLEIFQTYAEIWPITSQKLEYGGIVFWKNFSYWNTSAETLCAPDRGGDTGVCEK